MGAVKLRIGDKVITPWRMHWKCTQVIGGWRPGYIVAIRGDHLIVADINGNYEHEHPAYEVKPYPRQRRDWPKISRQVSY